MRWEYTVLGGCIERSSDEEDDFSVREHPELALEHTLNEYGQHGWELISVIDRSNRGVERYLLFLKRLAVNPPDSDEDLMS